MKRKIPTPTPHQLCSAWIEKLNAIHPDDLSFDERLALHKHLETCSHCQNVHTKYRAIDTLITGLPPVEPLPGLPAHLQELVGASEEAGKLLKKHDYQEPLLLPPGSALGDALPRNRVPQHRFGTLKKKLNFAVTALVVTALLGSFWFLFSTHQPGSGASGALPPLYVITAAQDGRTQKVLSALDSANGQVIWQQHLDDTLTGYGFALSDNLYVPTENGNVYAFSTRDGRQLWHTSISHSPRGFTGTWLMASANLLLASVTNRTTDDGYLYALNPQTGNLVWQQHIQCDTTSPSDCKGGERLNLLANGIIYGLADDGLSAWNAVDGHFLWRNSHYQANGQPQSLVVAHGKIYITEFYPRVDILEANTGHFLHSLTPPESANAGGAIYDIASDENTIYVLGDSSVFAYRAGDDSLLWKRQFGYHSLGTIYANGSSIYVNYTDITMGKFSPGQRSSSAPPFYALRASDGQQLWQLQDPVGDGFTTAFELHDVVCIGSSSGVFAFQASNGYQLWHALQNQSIQGLIAG